MKPEEAIGYEGEDQVVHFTDYLLRKAKSSKTKSFSSSFSEFDLKCGLETGEVVVITGHRKQGKTLFAESWVRSMAEHDPEGAKVVFMSYETPAIEVANRLNDNPKLPVYMPLQLSRGNFEWIEKKCLEAKYKFMARIVVIDHLGFIVDMATKENMSLNIGGCMRRLKTLAIEHELAIIVLAHQSMPKKGQDPSVDTLFGSVSIGQESDATIVVMRQKNFNDVELKDFANRAGEEKLHLVMPPALADPFDENSAQLALVKVDCHRRTGVWEWKKLFRKSEKYLVEV